MNQISIGEWKSIETGLRAQVVRVDEFQVWYTIPQFRSQISCAKDVWLNSMVFK